ncbi:stalk domain-containing protein [Paenibacillus filicis]|uniref:Stalk domain-containing protein n=1 Tax=Paenibacillus gyeongsangnamensis TaxID=3388067 RepID=A0ABT4QKC4_9BACL|nr:alkaline phosphatase family protein [Paenibacillus filicis]MCZ8517324.1 stalk domain-containing protein [Paenibacillus filicis]
MKKGFRCLVASTSALLLAATPFATLASAESSPTTSSPIKHTVVIFQENRSFDNYFGTYPYAPGFKPLSGTPQDVRNFKYVAGNEVRDVAGNVYNPDDNGNPVYPWHDAGNANVQEVDVNHNYADMISMINGGKMDKFYTMNSKGTTLNPTRGKLSMSYFDHNDIPAYWQYAQHFALADNYFQPVAGPSTPGALYLVAAQSGNGSAAANNKDPNSQITGDPTPKNGPFGGDNSAGLTYNLTYKNIGDELTDSNQSWAWYSGGWDAAKAATNATKPALDKTSLSTVSPEALKYSPHHNPFQYFQNYEDGKYDNNLKDYNNFTTDVANGTLPQVSFVKAGYGDDEHPGLGNQSTPSAEDFTVKTINQIMNSPYWKDTAIIITYDESGGFYDHIAPPAAVTTADGMVGNGPRIPALVISPYAKQNYVSHVQYDHTSILKFIETNYNLPALNNRDAVANNLTDMFDLNNPNFTPYMYQDDNSLSVSPWGTPAKVQFNNALLAHGLNEENAFIKDSNTMIPIVDLARNLNATVSYDNNTQTVTLQYNGHSVGLKLYSNQATIDGHSITLKDAIWDSSSSHGYISAKSLVDLPNLSVTTNDQGATIQTK